MINMQNNHTILQYKNFLQTDIFCDISIIYYQIIDKSDVVNDMNRVR